MQNYFNHKEAAKRYKTGRPNFHSLVVDKIKTQLRLEKKLDICLDVACGTGLLTEALLNISEKVIGLDNSEGMLSQANENERINYILGEAEDLSVVKGFVDLISVSSAFHWLDQAAFLKTSYEKLKQDKYLVIHNNSFTSSTKDGDSNLFKNWMKESYLKKFASPKRNQKPVDQSEISSMGFEIVKDDKFENVVPFNKAGLINYLITQSNVISNVELGEYTLDEVKNWLSEELAVHFEKIETRNFVFGNHLEFLKRN